MAEKQKDLETMFKNVQEQLMSTSQGIQKNNEQLMASNEEMKDKLTTKL